MVKKELDPNLMNKTQTAHMKVHSQILKDLSSGIYSNPANSIKELIINSYDADALNVTVRAKPDLDSFTIMDDGGGMNCDDFESKFTWISHSEKRKEGDFSEKLERPLVGRFGIGFISASQLCDKMTVISSKDGEAKKLRADIDFSKYKEHEPYGEAKDVYEVSEYNFINLEEAKDEHYTIIILSELSQEFKDILTDKELIEELGEMDKKEKRKLKRVDLENFSFEEIIETISQKKIQEVEKKVGTYWQFVIDIANTVPVPYSSKGPLNIDKKDPILKNIIEDVKKYKFSVEIDGIELKKPVVLPNSRDIKKEGEDFNVYFFKESQKIAGETLKFRGYFYNQKNQITPTDFQGVLIRIRNVAIGKADKSFLNYPWGEKMWTAWTFGEIYVDNGLESALNINRNSFVINHPHYMYLQKYIRNLLHDTIFIRTRKRYEERKKKTGALKEKERKKTITKVLKLKRRKEVKILRLSKKSEEKKSSDYLELKKSEIEDPVFVDSETGTIVLNDRHRVFSKLKKRDREPLEEILTLFEIAREQSEGDLDKLKQLFFKSLEGWRR